MADKLAGIDVHKRVLMVAVASRECPEARLAEGRFGTGASEMERLRVWLSEQGVRVVVMESTAQYWKPVWLALEGHVELALAQAHSNRAPQAPHGRKSDFRDAHRLVRRYMANELYLSFIPDAEQRAWRTMTRTKVQIIRDRVRVQNQMESLLEEMRIKLSSVISDLLGKSGRRILRALAEGEVDPAQLASLGDDRLRCSQKELVDALTGSSTAIQRKLLGFQLDHVELLDGQIAKIDGMLAEAFQAHQDAVVRLAEVPGFGPIRRRR